jgi:hypothetical protein
MKELILCCAGSGNSLELTNSGVIAIAAGVFGIIALIIGGVTYHIVRKESDESLLVRKVPL